MSLEQFLVPSRCLIHLSTEVRNGDITLAGVAHGIECQPVD